LPYCQIAAKKLPKSCQKAAKKLQKSCQKAAKKLPKSCQKAAKKLQKSCQKAAKKLPKSCQKAAEKLLKRLTYKKGVRKTLMKLTPERSWMKNSKTRCCFDKLERFLDKLVRFWIS